MAVMGTNHIALSKVSKSSKRKLEHSLLPWGDIENSLWATTPWGVDVFFIRSQVLKGLYITRVNNKVEQKHSNHPHRVAELSSLNKPCWLRKEFILFKVYSILQEQSSGITSYSDCELNFLTVQQIKCQILQSVVQILSVATQSH